MTLITDQYRCLQSMLHTEREDYGTSSVKHIEQIRAICEQLGTRDVLDYGCGKAMLAKGLPFPIQNYDPCIPEWSARPVPADIVVCTDVLEHIEMECLLDVMADLKHMTKKLLVCEVACRPATKFLADGRNAHILQQPPSWWLKVMLEYFDLYQFQCGKGGFVALFVLPQPSPSSEADNA